MSGHSKWATIKRQKAVTDAKKGALFTRLAKNIAIAARRGKDPEMNAALRTAIDAAKAANMPKDNIERAVLKGAGEVPGVVYEEVMYEGYGPGGVAMLIECTTDNTNRTVSFVRSTFTKLGGSMGTSGSVLFLFDQRGVIRIAREDIAGKSQDDVELLAIDAGAQDIQTESEGITVFTAREDFHAVLDTVKKAGLVPASASIEWVAKSTTDVPPEQAAQLQTLIEALEDNEDVNAIFTTAGNTPA